jgi:hypothetical protein
VAVAAPIIPKAMIVPSLCHVHMVTVDRPGMKSTGRTHCDGIPRMCVSVVHRLGSSLVTALNFWAKADAKSKLDAAAAAKDAAKAAETKKATAAKAASEAKLGARTGLGLH